jgi:hypothetical protein
LLHTALPLALEAWLGDTKARPARSLRRRLADPAAP